MKAKRTIRIGPYVSLTIEDLLSVAGPVEDDDYALVEFDFARDAGPLDASRAWVETVTEGLSQGRPQVVYGVNTGFGGNKHTIISKENLRALQRKLILSTACGVGRPLAIDVVRAAMLLRAQSLAQGYSGIRRVVLETLINMLNRGVHPIIPEQGSVGASGDLAPLAHMTLVMTKDPADGDERNSGWAYYGAEGHFTGDEAMRRAGIPRIVLEAKEGLALINGVQFITALGALTLAAAERLLQAAQVAAAMTMEALRGTMDAFHPVLHSVRKHIGQRIVAGNIAKLVEGSELVFLYERDAGAHAEWLACRATGPHPSPAAERFPKETVQDVYSVRCAPQVLGANLDLLAFARTVLEDEMNSATDNPLIFVDLPRDNKAISGGNFHGAPVASVADYLKIALCQLGAISERRTAILVDKHHNNGLPGFLVRGEEYGLDCGFMIPQYVAAALVSENKVLAHPASVDSIPTSADAEDHVSMGMHGARQARQILQNVERVVAIELFCAAQGLEFRRREHTELRLGGGTQAALRYLRERIPFLERDRTMSGDLEAITEEIRSGRLVHAVEQTTGPLARRPG
ncbi:MAG: aromatic amino acid lyase [Acidobacteria bacterium]|nr:aromatic amino acid lyase [Acidobacteriota bacterium]MBI3655456.1 aromatic amino acid lyase [Acidobacteriota bacterium]